MNRQQEAFVNRLDELCKEKGISYYKLAYKADVPLSTLINIREGKSHNPGLLTIMKICDGLGVTMKEFFDSELFNEIEKE